MNGNDGVVVDSDVAYVLFGGGASKKENCFCFALFEIDGERMGGEVVVKSGCVLFESVEKLLIGFGVDEEYDVVDPCEVGGIGTVE